MEYNLERQLRGLRVEGKPSVVLGGPDELDRPNMCLLSMGMHDYYLVEGSENSEGQGARA